MTIKRVTFLQELLGFIGLEDRLHLSWISSAEAGKYIDVVNGFTEKIRSLGPNPLKEFDLEPWLKRFEEKGVADENTLLQQAKGSFELPAGAEEVELVR